MITEHMGQVVHSHKAVLYGPLMAFKFYNFKKT